MKGAVTVRPVNGIDRARRLGVDKSQMIANVERRVRACVRACVRV
jgi:hypothetical protein